MDAHLPILVVVAPLLAALATALFRNGRLAWLIALAALLATAGLAFRLATLVAAGGPVSYRLGGWPAEIGIEYRVDLLGALMIVVVAAMAAAVAAMARRSVEREIAADRVAWFYTMLLVCVAGLLGIAVTGDAFNAFVFLEISSLSSYAMIALGTDRRALLAAYQYLILGTIGATFYVIGVGLIYIETGTLNMGLLAERLPAVFGSRAVTAGFAFIVVGIGLKLALFPLHRWLPNAYAFAPSVATALLAATATKVALYLLIRFLFTVFGPGFAFGDLGLEPALIVLSLAAMFGASAVAVVQTDLKRLLAYSSVGQIGYVTLGLSMATPAGLSAALLQIVSHAVIKGTLFIVVAGFVLRTGSSRIADLAGIARTMPWSFGAFVVAGIGLIGVPGTAGFVAKWALVSAAFAGGLWWLGAAIVLSSLIAVLYLGRFAEAALFRPAPAAAPTRAEPIAIVSVAWLLCAAIILLGFDAGPLADLADRAGVALAGPVP